MTNEDIEKIMPNNPSEREIKQVAKQTRNIINA